MPKALYLLNAEPAAQVYGPSERDEIARLVEIIGPPQDSQSIREHPELLAQAEILLSGWGMARLDEQFLAAAPRLKAVFYGAGTVRGFMTEAAWQRGIVVSSAFAANAIPVAEFTLAAILFALKQAFRFILAAKRDRAHAAHRDLAIAGAYGSTVGLISLGMVGRAVAQRLQPFDLRVLAFDPFVTPAQARELGVELVALEEIFATADVVSLHTPNLPATRGLITGAHFRAMKQGATFINTARGAVVREPELIEVFTQRPDLTAVLDVTDPEPPVPGSPLFELPNVILTPHIAGSQQGECRRLGRYMVEELGRYVAGQPLQWAITPAIAARLA